MAHSELLRMLLADARLPVAGHTQSAQLEPAVAAGLAAADIPAYLRARLETVACVEAATAVVGLRHLHDGRPLGPVRAAWAARTPSPAMRTTSRAQGRALLRLATRLWPDAEPVRTVRELPEAPRPLAVAAVAAVGGLGAASLARLIGYDDLQTVCSAALKLLPLDPAQATSWVVEGLDDVERLAELVGRLEDPADIPAAGAPQIEAWAEAHAVTTRRLFSA